MEARTPKVLSANQIEAHVTRLQAVREGLRKFEGEDDRAKEAGVIIEVAIVTLQQDVSAPQKAAEEAAAPIDVTEDSLPTSVLKDEAEEAAAVMNAAGQQMTDEVTEPEEEADPTNHSDPSNLPPPTPIRRE